MNSEDLVSIITPSYNNNLYIEKTINSVIEQTHTNWELLIVDDCSNDNSVEIIDSFCDKRIKVIKNSVNCGAAICRNKALALAKGKWIAFLDSDDYWLPNKLEKQIDFMTRNNYDFSFTDYRVSNNDILSDYVITAPNIVTKRKLYNWCYFFTSTVMYDKEKIGLIQIEDLKKNNDYAMWFQALEKTNAYRLSECLAYYNRHDNSISSGSKLKLIKHHYILYRKELKKGKIISIILTINNLIFGLIKKIKYKEKATNYIYE